MGAEQEKLPGWMDGLGGDNRFPAAAARIHRLRLRPFYQLFTLQ